MGKIKIEIVKDATAPGGFAMWTPEKGWHNAPAGTKAIILLVAR